MTSIGNPWEEGGSGAEPEKSGQIFPEEGAYLYNQAVEIGGPVLELGVSRGTSSRYIMKGLEKRGGGLMVGVDIVQYWEDNDAAKWMAQYAPNCTRIFLQHTSHDVDNLPVIQKLSGRFKWAFIDADHSYEAVYRDMALCHRLGIKVLVHHDTAPKAQDGVRIGARKAVMDFIEAHPQWRITRDCQELCGQLTMERTDESS